MDRAGQIECVTHGVLAFDRDIVQEAHKVEDKVGMDNIFKGFLVEVGIDPKQDSVAIASIKWMLALFGPDNLSKPWNYHNEFLEYLKRNTKITKSHSLSMLKMQGLVVCLDVLQLHAIVGLIFHIFLTPMTI